MFSEVAEIARVAQILIFNFTRPHAITYTNCDCLNRKHSCDDHTFISKMFPIKNNNNNYIGMKKTRYVPLNILMPNFVTFLVFEGVALSTKELIFASVNSDPNRLLLAIFSWSRKTVYLLLCSLTIFSSADI